MDKKLLKLLTLLVENMPSQDCNGWGEWIPNKTKSKAQILLTELSDSRINQRRKTERPRSIRTGRDGRRVPK
jgi:hypothetical protein